MFFWDKGRILEEISQRDMGGEHFVADLFRRVVRGIAFDEMRRWYAGQLC